MHNYRSHLYNYAQLDFVVYYLTTFLLPSPGASSLDLPPTAHGLFPGGAIELVHHFYKTTNEQMSEQLQAELLRDQTLELE